jgi:RHS repeat-associated protein
MGSPPTDTVTPLATFIYGYDAANRLTTQVDAEGTATFTYDNIDELTGVGGSRSEAYGFDANGNRNTTGYTVISGNRYSSGGGFTFSYDAEGNVTGKTEVATGNAWTFGFDQRNRMTGATEKNSGGTTIMQATYTYDALGRRIGTKVDDDGSGPHAAVQTWTVYDGGGSDANTYADFDGSGNLLTRYLYAPAVDALLARTSSGGTTAWYLPDKLGSIRDIADTTGAVIDHVVYSSYGGVNSETDSANGDRFKFTGREYGGEAGLYYYRARYYDPKTGRFTGVDPMGFDAGDSNTFRYVGNSPIDYTDPSGLENPGDNHSYPMHLGGHPKEQPKYDMDGPNHTRFHDYFRENKIGPGSGDAGRKEWASWSPEKQKEFIKNALRRANVPESWIQENIDAIMKRGRPGFNFSPYKNASKEVLKAAEAKADKLMKKMAAVAAAKAMKKTAAAAAAKAINPVSRMLKPAMRGGLKVGRAIPFIGPAFALFGWGRDAYAKGPIAGTANAGLDAIPLLGTGKIVIEMLRGEDFIADRR